MNKQKILDTVYKNLKKQGMCSKNIRGKCMYRAGELSCAIGGLIPDRLYKPGMEDLTVRSLLTKFKDVTEHLGAETCEDHEFLGAVQYHMHDAHDGCQEFMDFLNTAAAYIATIYNLKNPAQEQT